MKKRWHHLRNCVNSQRAKVSAIPLILSQKPVAEKADRDVSNPTPLIRDQQQTAVPRWISVDEALPDDSFTVVMAVVYASNGI